MNLYSETTLHEKKSAKVHVKTQVSQILWNQFKIAYLLGLTMADFFTKHLPFWLLAKNLKKQSFGARSINHSWIF